MNRSISFKILSLCCLAFLFYSCVDLLRNDDDTSTPFNVSGMESTIESGSWRVSNFQVDGNNEASVYNGYSLEFVENSALIANGSGGTASGSWSVYRSEDYDSGYLEIYFSTIGDFPQLNGSWLIMEYSNNQIKLLGTGSTIGDYLTLAR